MYIMYIHYRAPVRILHNSHDKYPQPLMFMGIKFNHYCAWNLFAPNGVRPFAGIIYRAYLYMHWNMCRIRGSEYTKTKLLSINLSFGEIVSICMSCVQEERHSSHRCGNTRQDDSYNDKPCDVSTHVLWRAKLWGLPCVDIFTWYGVFHRTYVLRSLWFHTLNIDDNCWTWHSTFHNIYTPFCFALFLGILS